MEKTLPTIGDFFTGRDIFVTGGSGFMGKALIEKLLRSCPGITKIFVLIRPKNGLDTSERLNKLKDESIFFRIKEENPDLLNKLLPISGDVTLLGLGLSDESIIEMENVSVIFHSAASVKFDDPLKDAIILNTRGTREICRFAEKLKKFDILLHVSTMYCNCDYTTIKEEMYPPKANWEDAIRIAENVDSEILDGLTAKFTSFAPNTYTFTKALGEHVINSFKDRLPVVIFRPSIVIGALEEPMPGWLDNFNGPVGILVAGGIGIMRSLYGDPNAIAEFTPVDVAIKSIIACAWRHGIKPEKEFSVYNCSPTTIQNISYKILAETGFEISRVIPLDNIVWAPSCIVTKNRFLHYIKVIFLHLLPAIILDKILKISGKKEFLQRLQRKIYSANIAVEFFLMHEWTFQHENFTKLCDDIPESDRNDFQTNHFVGIDFKAYLGSCILGTKRYLFNEKDEKIPRTLVKRNRLILADKTIKALVIFIIGFYTFIELRKSLSFNYT